MHEEPTASDLELRESHVRLRALFEGMEEGFCSIELVYNDHGEPVNYRFLETNPAFESHSGLIGAAGKTILEMVPEFESQWFKEYHQVAVTGQPLRFESEFKSMNHWFDVSVTRADATGRLIILFKDITVRKIAEARLKDSEERVRLATEAAELGLWAWTVADDKVTWENARMYAIFGMSPSDPPVNAARFTSEIVHPDDEAPFRQAIASALQSGERFYFEGRLRRVDTHALRWIEFTGVPQTSPEGVIVRVVGTAADITERKLAQRELREMAAALSDADRRKNDFLATLAHELRNPLAPITNGLHLLERSADPAVVKMVQMMSRQVKQMTHLVDDLLDVVRISTGKIELRKEHADLRSLINSAVETSAPIINAGNHRVNLTLPAEKVWLDVDAIRLSQVIGNLLSNAAKYSSEPGVIQVTAHTTDAAVVIAVADSGIGIAPESLGKVFDMFTQVTAGKSLAQGGLGIGLSLVRKLVELHGGTVTASSDGPGCGSTFTVTLPRTAATDPSRGDRTGGAEQGQPGFRIMVVDDNRDAGESLATILEMLGHTTRLAYDGHEAVQVATEFLPHIAFLDIGLPGLNGYEVAATFRKNPALQKATLIALTGWGTEVDRIKAETTGFDHHLTKPAEIVVIEKLIKGVSDAQRANRIPV